MENVTLLTLYKNENGVLTEEEVEYPFVPRKGDAISHKGKFYEVVTILINTENLSCSVRLK